MSFSDCNFSMSNDQKLNSPLKAKYKLIIDPKVLEKIRLEEEEAVKKGEAILYIAPDETDDTFDQEILSGRGHDLKKSSNEVGQLRPIEVAIWFDDPNKNSKNSTERIHRRIVNGRHRFVEVPDWRREYYDFSEFAKDGDLLRPTLEYNLAKRHFDLQKKPTRAELQVWTKNMCILGMKKGVPKTDCCNWVVQLAEKQGISNQNSIREACPDEFKNKDMASRKLDKTFKSKGIDTKEIKKLKKVAGEKFQQLEATKIKLESQNFQYEKEIIGLREDNKKRTDVQEELQSQLRTITNINHPHKCKKCGTETELKVDATSGKVLVTDKK